jgi:beta-glucosidase/6-phospho-beta-glucosidase/beta-galactosidase
MSSATENIFSSFLMAGYECSDHVNRSGERVNLLARTGHDQLADTDYQLLKPFHITTVREGICWGFVEAEPGRYNWDEVKNRIEAGLKNNIQQVWDICHMGLPSDLVPTHPRFADRLSAVCAAFIELWKSMTDKKLVIVPVNEISFLSWHAGDVRGTVPFAENQSYDLKIHFLKAVIKVAEMIRLNFPDVLIMQSEPLINIVAPDNAPSVHAEVALQNSYQFQSTDILSGYQLPELGGSATHFDVMGVNFYFTNQWEHGSNRRLNWHPEYAEPGWKPLSEMLQEVYLRYKKPLVLSETSHMGDHRASWIIDVARECELAIASGTDLRGLCIYPIIDRPDWDYPYEFHNVGLWNVGEGKERILCEPYAAAVSEIVKRFPSAAPHEVSAGLARAAHA